MKRSEVFITWALLFLILGNQLDGVVAGIDYVLSAVMAVYATFLLSLGE